MGEIPDRVKEPIEDRNARRARGEISEQEIAEYLMHPEDVLFEYKLKTEKRGKVMESDIRVRALTKEFLESTLENLRGSWDDVSFENLKETLYAYFEQKESGRPGLLNVEYYIATDLQDKPIGMTGLYTVDIQGGAGFATRDRLDPERHNLNMGLGWYSVSKDVQGTGLGKYLLEWTENFAKARGAKHFEIETDDWSVSTKAVSMYKKSGYKEGFPEKDFYGPGRDLCIYYCDCSEDPQKEMAEQEAVPAEITEGNKAHILEIARQNYSADRFEEFQACLDLFLSQSADSGAVIVGHSLVLTDALGNPESFAIYADGIYDNFTPVYWLGAEKGQTGAKEKLLASLKSISRANEKDVIMVYNENKDEDLKAQGFSEARHGVPGIFGKEDTTKFLMFTKSLK